MDRAVQDQLLGLNRQFYEQFADDFAETRSSRQPGLGQLLAFLPIGGRWLDVGCGNGRLATLLDTAGREAAYVGVDASARLVEIARRNAASLQRVRAEFRVMDVAIDGWASGWPPASFDAITLLAFLHHLPGWKARQELLSTLRLLLVPGGVLALSTWQFLNEERLRRKIAPWERVGLEAGQLEPGDYLLDWRRGGYGLRYCHLIDQAEMESLARSAGLVVRRLFYADGASGALNLFGVLESPDPGKAINESASW